MSNGPKEQLGVGEGAGGSEDFESWRSQQQPQQSTASHTPYGATAPISSATDLYGMSTGGKLPFYFIVFYPLLRPIQTEHNIIQRYTRQRIELGHCNCM